ncbi:glycosyltransferase family 39 protein [Desulforhabdus sp. TSK]|uniref:ArnT family glycosyltransferase n=1 Tax=Desulforhabdus sp. TSK TaxID=2925014 RepID=UPI001FC89FE2|nr:glycosyltransferase family 39 protein [Desulforhabdus sp. TSK]GKT10243.1 hypothetical protein DSTSK_35480 [Desulforhabdus sp. TSK]
MDSRDHLPPALWKILLLAFVAVTAFQGSRGLYESTEGRYAECAREMLVTGRFLEPTLEFQPHWTKPPLTYWAIAAGMTLFGQNAWGARAYLVAAFCLTVLAVYRLAQYLWDRDTAPYAALVYATAPFPLIAANTINADTLLTLWETLAMLGFWTGVRKGDAWGFRFMWLCLGGAFFTKGPPGLIPLLSALPTYAFMKLKLRHPLPPFFSVSGILLFLGLGLSWYGYEIMVHEGLLQYWMRDEIVGRIATREFHRNEEWYKVLIEYVPVLLFGGIPWVVLAAGHFRSIRWPGARWLDAEYWKERTEWLFLFLSFTVPFLIFAVSRSRLPLYVLPLFVPIALALGRAIHQLVESGRVSVPRLHRFALAAVLVVMMGKVAMVHWPSHRNMEQLLLEIRDAAPGAERGRLYLVYDHPLYGLHFYLRESFVRVSSKFTRAQNPARLPVSELPARLGDDCAAGATPRILIPKGQQEGVRELLPLDLNRNGEGENRFVDENGDPRSSTGKVNDGAGAGAPKAAGGLDVLELKSPWVLVFPCGGHPSD